MAIIFLTVPGCLLSLYLAFLCYRKAFYKHALVLSMVAGFMLIVTLAVVVIGYSAWCVIDEELVTLGQLASDLSILS
jgi:hypothetical protein